MSDNKNLKEKARKGIVWTILRAFSSQGARFLASIALARLLLPADFGIMGIILIVTRFAQRIGNFGFTQVLVQRKDIDESHIRTTFTINLIISAATTAVIYFLSPYIAEFVTRESDKQYIPTVINVLKVISFNFIIISFYTIPLTLLKRNMRFKQSSIVGIIGSIIRYLGPVVFAFFGYGVWSIVFGMMLAETIQVLAFYGYTRWKPKLGLSRSAMKEVFSFGIWMNMYSYVQYFYKNSAYFFISKFLGLGLLGYYERAFNLMNAPRKRIAEMINGVLFATYSRIQDEDERLTNAIIKVINGVSIVTFPMMIGLYFSAPALIPFLYGENWMLTIEPLQIMSVSGLIESVTMVFYPAFLAKGLVKNRTKVHFWALILLIILLVFSSQVSIVMVAWAVVVVSLFGFFVNSREYINNSGLTWGALFKSLQPAFVISLFMIAALVGARFLAIQYITIYSGLMLLINIVVGLLTFFGTIFIFKFAEIGDVLELVMGKKYKKLKKRFTKNG